MKTLFISGPHGSGKTTLLNKLLQDKNHFEKLDFQIDFLKEFETISNQTIFEKCITRLYHRFYTGVLANNLCKDNSEDKFLLVDRSIYDSIAYIEVERQLNQLNDYQYNTLKEIADNSLKIINPRTILLNPKIDTTLERLETRRLSGVRKERDLLCGREDNSEYLTLISNSFKKYAQEKNILEITDNDENSIKQIYSWLQYE